MKEKNIILTARIMSMIFTPFYLPMVGLIALFIFSYMSLLPIGYKLVMLGMVYLLTVVAPSLLIHLYRMVQGWTSRELGKKERRIVPYILSIVCYFGCFFWMEYRNTPRVISIIVVVALAIQMICAFINVWWKISTHTAAIGGVAGDSGVLFCSLQFQSAVVALPCADDGRRSRKCPHDTPTTYAVTGSYRISDRNHLCYIGNIKFIIKYKKK